MATLPITLPLDHAVVIRHDRYDECLLSTSLVGNAVKGSDTLFGYTTARGEGDKMILRWYGLVAEVIVVP